LLEVFELDVKKGKKEKLVKLRDQFRTVDWKGDWSKDSSLWTRDI